MRQNAYQLLWICILVTACLIFLCDVLRVHRINSFREVQNILLTTSRPTDGSHCRIYNASHHQCLPNVLIIGASKAGTTTLVNYLRQLRRVHFVDRRLTKNDNHTEVHRFDRASYGRAWKSIELLHEWASSPIIQNKNDIVIHYTPHYLFAPTVPFEMNSFYPHTQDIKFIVSIRDPVDRMWSSYWFKNSHLFHGEDKGTMKEFREVIQSQICEREDYELCMIAQFDASGLFSEVRNLPADSASISYSFQFNRSTSIRYLTYLSAFAELWLVCPEKIDRTTNIYASHPTTQCVHVPSLTPTLLLFYREIFDAMTRKCFGSMLRAKQLGLRHIEKSIYYDQILRWFLNFSPGQFVFLSLSDIASSPRQMLSQLFHDMHVDDIVCEKIKKAEPERVEVEGVEEMCDPLDIIDYDNLTRLSKPNRKSSNVELSDADKLSLRVYFEPYDTFLHRVVSSSST
jgi:hypothetical protein